MKNTLLFTYSTNIMVRLLTVNVKNFLTPKSEKWDLIPVTPLKIRPHYSQFSRENATPSSGTSPAASYKDPPHSEQNLSDVLRSTSRSAQSSFAPLQKSRQNHRSYVWTEALSGMVFVPAQQLHGIVWS